MASPPQSPPPRRASTDAHDDRRQSRDTDLSRSATHTGHHNHVHFEEPAAQSGLSTGTAPGEKPKGRARAHTGQFAVMRRVHHKGDPTGNIEVGLSLNVPGVHVPGNRHSLTQPGNRHSLGGPVDANSRSSLTSPQQHGMRGSRKLHGQDSSRTSLRSQERPEHPLEPTASAGLMTEDQTPDRARPECTPTREHHHEPYLDHASPQHLESEGTSEASHVTDLGSVELEEGKQDANCDIAPVPVHERADFIYVVGFACLLTVCSGFLNVVAFKAAGSLVTHTTGSTSKAASWMIDGEWYNFGHTCLLIGSFVFGSAISGAGVGKNKFVMGHSYGITMLFVGLVQIAGLLLIRWQEKNDKGVIDVGDLRLLGLSLWAISSGMQNAMCTSFSGAVVRTTHTTGMLTDIGMVIGHIMRDLCTKEGAGDVWKLRILVPQYFCYFIGGILAACAFRDMGIDAGFLPSGALIIAGTIYILLNEYGCFDEFLVEEKIEEEIAEVERQLVTALHHLYHTQDHVEEVRSAQRAKSVRQLSSLRQGHSDAGESGGGSGGVADHIRPIGGAGGTNSSKQLKVLASIRSQTESNHQSPGVRRDSDDSRPGTGGLAKGASIMLRMEQGSKSTLRNEPIHD